MNIGSLYTVKKWFWFLFPTKETATDAAVSRTVSAAAAAAEPASTYWSIQYNCEITYFSPETFVIFLEKDGKYKKVLTSDGKIGWIWFYQDYISCFEEVKTE